jgi:cytochrome c peroxidase
MRSLLLLTVLVACGKVPSPEVASIRAEFSAEELERLLRCAPLPAPVDATNGVLLDDQAFELGHTLFYDPRLSGDGATSCATCHDPARDWTDGRVHRVAASGVERNTPSLWNTALNRWFFWDGRADSLWAQALGPIENPMEMGGDRAAVAALVAADADLRGRYSAVFGQPPDDRTAAAVDEVFANVGKALAAFEARILTEDTPFDRFVRGLGSGDAEDLAALGPRARAGARLFFGSARCHLCHHGPQLSDLEFHDIRIASASPPEAGRHAGIAQVLRDPFNGLGAHSDDAEGARTKLAYLTRTGHQRGEWKTPGLRNVARTAPYMHSGVYPDLAAVLEHYSTLQDAASPAHPGGERILVPLDLSEQDKSDLLAFLEALSSPPAHADLLPRHQTHPAPIPQARD